MDENAIIGVEIAVAPPAHQRPALGLVISERATEGEPEQLGALLAAARLGTLSLDGLLEARRDGRQVGAAWVQTLPGKVAAEWVPQCVAGEPESTAGLLQEALDRFVVARGVRLVQTLLPSSDGRDADRLRRSGFAHAAQLLYLVSVAEQFPTKAPGGPLRFVPYRPVDHGWLARLVEKTFDQTLDCPALNGSQHIDDTLEGYQGTGVFSPERWLFVQNKRQDIGCLLLADHPEQDQWELVYMGLVPSARGQGFGLFVTRHAQWLARGAGRQQIVLAVDVANEPAVAMYAAAGFTAWHQRSVFLKFFGE